MCDGSEKRTHDQSGLDESTGDTQPKKKQAKSGAEADAGTAVGGPGPDGGGEKRSAPASESSERHNKSAKVARNSTASSLSVEQATFRVELHHIDVGQGESTLILVYFGPKIVRSILVDGGKQGAGDTVLAYLSKILGENKLDAVLATHFDNDHIGGLGAVLTGSKGSEALFVKAETQILERCPFDEIPENRDTGSYLRATRDLPNGRIAVQVGDELIQLGEGAPTLTCIAANGILMDAAKGKRDVIKEGREIDENGRSIALLLEFKSFSYFLGGDLGGELEDTAAAYAISKVGADHVCAYKCSHHGSNHGTHSQLLADLKPRAAFISCGRRNTFRTEHHPGQRVIFDLELSKSIQKYYLTNCGYWRYGVNLPTSDKWPVDATPTLSFWEDTIKVVDTKAKTFLDPDQDRYYNPTLNDIFTELGSDRKKVKEFVKMVAEETAKYLDPHCKYGDGQRDQGPAPAADPDYETCVDRVLALFDADGFSARKSSFVAELKSCGYSTEELRERGLDAYDAFRLDYTFYKQYLTFLEAAFEDHALSATGVDKAVVDTINWEQKKAVVAGGPETYGHLVLEVDEAGAAKHEFRVHYHSREFQQSDRDHPMPVVAVHDCAKSSSFSKDQALSLWMPRLGESEDSGSSGYRNVGGGDCLFHAVLHMIAESAGTPAAMPFPAGTDDTHSLDQRIQALRNLVRDEILNNPHPYVHFLVGAETLAEVAAALATLGSWRHIGGDLAPLAIAHVLGRQFGILNHLTGITLPINHTLIHGVPLGVNTPIINYNGHNHYW